MLRQSTTMKERYHESITLLLFLYISKLECTPASVGGKTVEKSLCCFQVILTHWCLNSQCKYPLTSGSVAFGCLCDPPEDAVHTWFQSVSTAREVVLYCYRSLLGFHHKVTDPCNGRADFPFSFDEKSSLLSYQFPFIHSFARPLRPYNG